MPDAALEATEAQFSRLLRAASGLHTVQLRIAYLPEVPRAPEVAARIARDHWHVDDLLARSVDALIVTGLEPKAANLVDEPYWGRFVALLRWAQAHTASSVWSCLAAHGAVQHLDGVLRRRLAEKRFGVFEHTVHAGHALMADVASPLAIPHSRWNELPASELRSAGYSLLSYGPQTGADMFVKSAGLAIAARGRFAVALSIMMQPKSIVSILGLTLETFASAIRCFIKAIGNSLLIRYPVTIPIRDRTMTPAGWLMRSC